MAAVIVGLLGVAGLLLVAWMIRTERQSTARAAAIAGAVAGFMVAVAMALLTDKPAGAALAVGLIGAAVLPIAVLGQMRLVRALTRRR
jgi:hypothetical protein